MQNRKLRMAMIGGGMDAFIGAVHRLAYPFRWAGRGGELAWIVQSANGAHFEYKAYNNPADRIVERRQWLTLRLDF